jgi:hypothetical protein
MPRPVVNVDRIVESLESTGASSPVACTIVAKAVKVLPCVQKFEEGFALVWKYTVKIFIQPHMITFNSSSAYGR